jgi:hypothetical protein
MLLGMFRPLAFFLLLSTGAAVNGQGQDSSIASEIASQHSGSAGLLNGRFWVARNDGQKVIFIMGYCEAARSGKVPDRHDSPLALASCPTEVTLGDILKGLDRFYQEPENLRLAIRSALRIFAMKVAGASANDIEQELAAARAIVDSTPAKLP